MKLSFIEADCNCHAQMIGHGTQEFAHTHILIASVSKLHRPTDFTVKAVGQVVHTLNLIQL